MSGFKDAARRVSRRFFGPRISRFVADAAFAVRPVRRGGSPGSHVVLAAPGGGNIGDQAMAEACFASLPGAVVLVVKSAADFEVPHEYADRVTILEFPGLLYGDITRFARSLPGLRALLSGAHSVSVVGADIMDGAYSSRASTRRSLVAEIAARAGISSRILGFSWNGRAHPDAVAALRRAGAAGVELFLRDPLSAARAIADGLDHVNRAADLVFTSPPATVSRVLPPVALVNVSGLIDRTIDQVPHYRRIVRHLLDAGFSVTFVPHVSRSGGDDIASARAVFDTFPHEDVRFVDRLMTPTEIRDLCGTASITVTGRMHLAIMSLLAGVPPVTFETQGKVTGLMTLFGAEQLCVTVGDSMGDDAIGALEETIPRLAELSASISAALPGVVAMARTNFQELPSRLLVE